MLQPTNVATPKTAAFVVLPVHANVAEPGTVNVKITELVSLVTVLPPRSCTVIPG